MAAVLREGVRLRALWSFLVASGYLTASEPVRDVGGLTYHLRIPNRELGRADIGLTPRDTSQRGFVLEFKSISPDADLDSALADALNQIEARRYAADLCTDGEGRPLGGSRHGLSSSSSGASRRRIGACPLTPIEVEVPERFRLDADAALD